MHIYWEMFLQMWGNKTKSCNTVSQELGNMLRQKDLIRIDGYHLKIQVLISPRDSWTD